MNLSLITCTGSRPEAFLLCQHWMDRQTKRWHQWFVLDDEEPKAQCLMGQEYIHCPQFKGRMSLLSKIHFILTSGRITGDGVVFIEDDDWYAPGWLAFCGDELSRHDMIGEGRAVYYNVRYRYWFQYQNMGHASLCATAIRTSQAHNLAAQCKISGNEDPFLDARMWPNLNCDKIVLDPHGKPLTVGIKGMPGRRGYNVGHDGPDWRAQNDPSLSKLKSLIGQDVKFYEPFYNE